MSNNFEEKIRQIKAFELGMEDQDPDLWQSFTLRQLVEKEAKKLTQIGVLELLLRAKFTERACKELEVEAEAKAQKRFTKRRAYAHKRKKRPLKKAELEKIELECQPAPVLKLDVEVLVNGYMNEAAEKLFLLLGVR